MTRREAVVVDVACRVGRQACDLGESHRSDRPAENQITLLGAFVVCPLQCQLTCGGLSRCKSRGSSIQTDRTFRARRAVDGRARSPVRGIVQIKARDWIDDLQARSSAMRGSKPRGAIGEI